MLTQHSFDMQGNIFCEQQSVVTKFGVLEMPLFQKSSQQGSVCKI
jgi:hypothetical protein